MDDREIGAEDMGDESSIGRAGVQLFVGGFPERYGSLFWKKIDFSCRGYEMVRSTTDIIFMCSCLGADSPRGIR